MVYLVETHKPLDQVAHALQDAAMKRRFRVLTVDNLTETMPKNGTSFERGCWIFEICDPSQTAPAPGSNSTTIPSCRIAVYQQGTAVKLATIRPTTLPEIRHESELQTVAEEVERRIIEMMNEVARQ